VCDRWKSGRIETLEKAVSEEVSQKDRHLARFLDAHAGEEMVLHIFPGSVDLADRSIEAQQSPPSGYRFAFSWMSNDAAYPEAFILFVLEKEHQ
jgi:hypothetical protein